LLQTRSGVQDGGALKWWIWNQGRRRWRKGGNSRDGA